MGIKTRSIIQAMKANRINNKFIQAARLDLTNKYPEPLLLKDKKKQRKTNRFNAALN